MCSSDLMREQVSLSIMCLIGQHYYQHKPALSLEALAKKMQLRLDVTRLLLTDLVKAELLVPTTATPSTYLPAHALETMKLNTIVATIRRIGETPTLRPEVLADVAGIATLFSDMDVAIDKAMGERSLRDLAMNAVSQ